MKNQKIRLTTVAGATMALVIAGTAAVSAAGPRDDDRGFGPGKARVDARQGAQMMPGMRGGMRGLAADVERREISVQTADGTTVQRVEQGVVDSASEASLGFSLASGEAVTVTIDEDTQVITFEEDTVTRRGRSRERMVPTEIDVAGIEAGAEILVWSDSEDGGDFMAERIIVQPADEEDTAEMTEDEAEMTEDETVAEAVEETATEEAASTDA